MPKVSFRMGSASQVGIRRTDQHGAEKSSVGPHRGPVDHHAKRLLRTKGTLTVGLTEQATPGSSTPVPTKGDLAVFIQVDDLDKTFESLRAAGTEILQEPIDQPYGVRDAAVRDPSGNHLR